MLFYYTYYKSLDQKGRGGVSIKDFLWKRIKRIYPTAIITCLVCYLIAVVAHFTYDPQASIGLVELVQDCLFWGQEPSVECLAIIMALSGFSLP